MVHFVHLTDIHLSDPAIEDGHLLSDTLAMLEQAVEAIGRIAPAPDFVAISGDLTNHGDEASYRLLERVIGRLDLPVIMALGNHDRREGFRAVFAPDAAEADGPVFHERVLAGVHVIVLDSSVPGRVGGAIGSGQFDLLDRALQACPDLPKLVLCHHPPYLPDTEALAWESLSEADSAALAARLKGQGVIALLSGHVHFDRVIHWHGIPVIVSTGLHNTVDVLESDGMVMEEGTGFAIGHFAGGVLDLKFVPLTPRRRVLGRIGAATLQGFE